jgi:hypothetical protein
MIGFRALRTDACRRLIWLWVFLWPNIVWCSSQRATSMNPMATALPPHGPAGASTQETSMAIHALLRQRVRAVTGQRHAGDRHRPNARFADATSPECHLVAAQRAASDGCRPRGVCPSTRPPRRHARPARREAGETVTPTQSTAAAFPSERHRA